MNWPRAAVIPALAAAQNPLFRLSRTKWTWGYEAVTQSAVPSLEQSSTTMTSVAHDRVRGNWWNTLLKQVSKRALPL
jgi:hypothetical protein